MPHAIHRTGSVGLLKERIRYAPSQKSPSFALATFVRLASTMIRYGSVDSEQHDGNPAQCCLKPETRIAISYVSRSTCVADTEVKKGLDEIVQDQGPHLLTRFIVR
jgi:hypothetical protein